MYKNNEERREQHRGGENLLVQSQKAKEQFII